LQSVDGAKKYNYSIKNTERIIGTATINDIAVVITKLNDEYNKIYRIENFNSPNPTSTVILKGKLGIGKDYDSNQISIVLNYETISNIKMYFTDGGSIIKVINIMDDKYV
jgi:replication initiation and membrane attachment protein DnaB